MNFLGHLYFSDNNSELMIANLFGDFCKGKQFLDYPVLIKNGVLLHRSIDHYIDNHINVKEVRSKLYATLPKVAGIAIDLYFDHLLSKHWDTYHPIPYMQYLEAFYKFESNYIDKYPKEFQWFLGKIKEHKWLNHYPTPYGLEKSCQGVAKRISFQNQLGNAPELMEPFKEELFYAFQNYMTDAITYFNLTPNTSKVSI